MRLIDADRLLRRLGLDGLISAETAESYDYANDELISIISQEAFLAKKDIVEVVRCKDCAGKKACDIWGIYLDDDDFCSKGR